MTGRSDRASGQSATRKVVVFNTNVYSTSVVQNLPCDRSFGSLARRELVHCGPSAVATKRDRAPAPTTKHKLTFQRKYSSFPSSNSNLANLLCRPISIEKRNRKIGTVQSYL